MKTLIVHLKGTDERLAHMMMQVNRESLDFEMVYAIDGKTFTPPNRTLASLHTHKNATKRVADLNKGPVLILEDDAVLVDCFMPKLEERIEMLNNYYPVWDIAFIGYNTQGENLWNTTIPHWKIKQGCQSQHHITFSGGWAYVINGKRAANKLLKLMTDKVNDWPFHDMMIKSLVNDDKLRAAWLCFRLADHGWFESTIKHYENNAIGETLPQYL